MSGGPGPKAWCVCGHERHQHDAVRMCLHLRCPCSNYKEDVAARTFTRAELLAFGERVRGKAEDRLKRTVQQESFEADDILDAVAFDVARLLDSGD